MFASLSKPSIDFAKVLTSYTPALFNVDERDIIIGIGFARYATRTIEALEFVRSKHGIVVAITDSLSSPLA